MVDIKYYGYHSMPEGASLFKEIISQWNNFRLSTNAELGSGGLISTTEEQVKLVNPNFIDFNEKFRLLLKLAADRSEIKSKRSKRSKRSKEK